MTYCRETISRIIKSSPHTCDIQAARQEYPDEKLLELAEARVILNAAGEAGYKVFVSAWYSPCVHVYFDDGFKPIDHPSYAAPFIVGRCKNKVVPLMPSQANALRDDISDKAQSVIDIKQQIAFLDEAIVARKTYTDAVLLGLADAAIIMDANDDAGRPAYLAAAYSRAVQPVFVDGTAANPFLFKVCRTEALPSSV